MCWKVKRRIATLALPRQQRTRSMSTSRTRLFLLATLLALLTIAPAAPAEDAVPAKAAAPVKTDSTPQDAAPAEDEASPHTRKQDVVYGRKHGVALTLDVFTPKKDPNG